MAEFYYTQYKDFIDQYNIKNGQIANQMKLNASVDILKKEVNDLYNRAQIIRGAEGFKWKSYTKYVPGEIVWYNGDTYRANVENYNEIPSPSSDIWHFVKRSEYTLDLDPSKYLRIDRTEVYVPTGDYNPATKKYVDDSILSLTSNDSSVSVNNARNADKLDGISSDDFVTAYPSQSSDYKGFKVAGNSTDWLRTTSAGLLPFDKNNVSSLGATGWEFKECHALKFFGISSTATHADLAEKYRSDKEYEEGTVLGIGGTEEVTLYQEGMPVAGIVSVNPAFKMNSKIDGIYVALKGRVPCKIKGSVKKGQYVNAYKDGEGIASDIKNDFTIGVALVDGTNLTEVKV